MTVVLVRETRQCWLILIMFEEDKELFSTFGSMSVGFFIFSLLFVSCVFINNCIILFLKNYFLLFLLVINFFVSRLMKRFHQPIIDFLGL